MFSKYEGRIDTRTYGDKLRLFDGVSFHHSWSYSKYMWLFLRFVIILMFWYLCFSIWEWGNRFLAWKHLNLPKLKFTKLLNIFSSLKYKQHPSLKDVQITKLTRIKSCCLMGYVNWKYAWQLLIIVKCF